MMFGCEADLRADLTLGITEERMEKMDMFLISTTHLHMDGFTISDEEEHYPTEIGIPGEFSLYNALAAVTAARLLGVSPGTRRGSFRTARASGGAVRSCRRAWITP